eukprot:14251175-Alexandrium_andersonii.AAC.1
MAWADDRLFIRAAQGHSIGVGDRVDVSQALEQVEPGHPRWVDVGLHGAKVDFVPSILREGLDAKYS